MRPRAPTFERTGRRYGAGVGGDASVPPVDGSVDDGSSLGWAEPVSLGRVHGRRSDRPCDRAAGVSGRRTGARQAGSTSPQTDTLAQVWAQSDPVG